LNFPKITNNNLFYFFVVISVSISHILLAFLARFRTTNQKLKSTHSQLLQDDDESMLPMLNTIKKIHSLLSCTYHSMTVPFLNNTHALASLGDNPPPAVDNHSKSSGELSYFRMVTIVFF